MDHMIIDRVSFLHSIDTIGIDYTSAVVSYFDQFMGVFNHFQPHNYTIVITGVLENILTLQMKFNDKESKDLILCHIQSTGNIIRVYQRTFGISSIVEGEDNTITIQSQSID